MRMRLKKIIKAQLIHKKKKKKGGALSRNFFFLATKQLR